MYNQILIAICFKSNILIFFLIPNIDFNKCMQKTPKNRNLLLKPVALLNDRRPIVNNAVKDSRRWHLLLTGFLV